MSSLTAYRIIFSRVIISAYHFLQHNRLRHANLNRVSLHDAVIDETTKISNKWRLVWEIINQPFKARNLSNANLSSADLSGTNMSGTNMSGKLIDI